MGAGADELANTKCDSPARSVTPPSAKIFPRLIDNATKTSLANAAVAPADATKKSDHPAPLSIFLPPDGPKSVQFLSSNPRYRTPEASIVRMHQERDERGNLA